MKRVLLLLTALAGSVCLSLHASAQTEPTRNRGLFISPLRSYISLDAGTSKTGKFTVANLTQQPLTVMFGVKQFSMQDYAYDYRFTDTTNDWLDLTASSTVLEPSRSSQVPYTLRVPTGTSAGGHYYTIFASAKISAGGLDSTVQATTLLYVTVNGALVQTSQLVGSAIPRVAFGTRIPYALDVKNTGNVHYFANFTAALHGLSAKAGQPGASHLLMPGAIREITGSIPAPLLPGIYKAVASYKTDAGTTAQTSRYVIFIPPWFAAVVALLALGTVAVLKRTRKRPDSDNDNPVV